MARAAGNTAPPALSGQQAMSLAFVALAGAFAAVFIDPLIGLPVAGAALAGLVYAGRTTVSVLVGLLAGLVAGSVLYGLVLPLFGDVITVRESAGQIVLTMASLLVAGPVTAVLMKRMSAFTTSVVLTGALTAGAVAELAIPASIAGQSVAAYLESMLGTVASQMGTTEEMARIISTWPGIYTGIGGLTALFVMVGVGAMGARFGVATRGVPPLTVLDLDIRTVVLPIVAVALLAAGKLPVQFASTLAIVGNNLLLVARLVFFLQGIAVFAGLYERAKFARPVRMLGFVVLGVTEMFVPAVSLTGLADMWLNLRRLPRDGVEARRPDPTPDGD
ncbi:MAG: DUF2232 domain-containing protein [Coriobacteriia bacterium]